MTRKKWVPFLFSLDSSCLQNQFAILRPQTRISSSFKSDNLDTFRTVSSHSDGKRTYTYLVGKNH